MQDQALFPAKRDQFLNNLRAHSFTDAMNYTNQDKFDIGLVSNYCAVNFGGSLTQFALCLGEYARMRKCR